MVPSGWIVFSMKRWTIKDIYKKYTASSNRVPRSSPALSTKLPPYRNAPAKPTPWLITTYRKCLQSKRRRQNKDIAENQPLSFAPLGDYPRDCKGNTGNTLTHQCITGRIGIVAPRAVVTVLVIIVVTKTRGRGGR